jgi:thiamine pyrophosphokinase
MEKVHAQKMMDDLGKHVIESDYCQNIYISTQLNGAKTFRKCAYFEAENYIFVWKKSESLLISKEEVGNYIIVPEKTDTIVTLKKVL